jgi:hypothetical protein
MLRFGEDVGIGGSFLIGAGHILFGGSAGAWRVLYAGYEHLLLALRLGMNGEYMMFTYGRLRGYWHVAAALFCGDLLCVVLLMDRIITC